MIPQKSKDQKSRSPESGRGDSCGGADDAEPKRMGRLYRGAAQKISPGSAQMYHLQRDIQPADRLPQSGGDIGRYGGHRRPRSSNSRKLYEIASEVCENTYFIENTSHLPLKDIAKYNKIGVSAGASAPERIIKEVISNMSDIITNNIDESNEMNDFMAEIEKSLKMPQRGEIVKGEVIQVGPREVYVNLGCKKDGIIPK